MGEWGREGRWLERLEGVRCRGLGRCGGWGGEGRRERRMGEGVGSGTAGPRGWMACKGDGRVRME